MLHRLAFTGVFCAPVARCSGVFCTRFGLARFRAFYDIRKLEEFSDLSRLYLYNMQSLFTAGAARGSAGPRSLCTFRKSCSACRDKNVELVPRIGCAVRPLEWCWGPRFAPRVPQSLAYPSLPNLNCKDQRNGRL